MSELLETVGRRKVAIVVAYSIQFHAIRFGRDHPFVSWFEDHTAAPLVAVLSMGAVPRERRFVA